MSECEQARKVVARFMLRAQFGDIDPDILELMVRLAVKASDEEVS